MEAEQTLGGRYRLLTELGSGGMAVVWKARDEVLARPVAVKVLAARFAGDEQSRARILDEARAAATLSHPNIAQIHDFGESEDGGACLPYVVMELVNGPTLAQRVAQGPIPPRSVFRICGEVAAALAAAHAHGLVHRDIKPANVMVTAAATKVVDFGIAAAAGPGRPDDELIGTPAYLAPERLLSDTIEPASDVYAVGVLLYRLLTNESPWTVESTTQMLDAHVYIEPIPMPQLPGVPPEITRLVDRCLRKEPAERPSAAELSSLLGDAADAVVVPLARPAVPAGGGPPAALAAAIAAPPAAPAKRRLLVAGGGVAVALVAAVLVWTLGQMQAERGQNGAVVPADRPAATSPGAVPAAPGAGVTSGAPGAPSVRGPGTPGAAAPTVAGTRVPVRPVATSSRATVPGGPTATTTSEPPGGGGGPATPPPATTEPPSGGRTLTSSGGSVVAECTDGKVLLTSWEPAQNHRVERVSAGPADVATITFRHKATRVRMTVTCVAGVPTAGG